MEVFRTVLANMKWDFQIGYPSSHFLIGSCFSEHIGNKLSRGKFSTLLNPFGILYHPNSIARVLNKLIDGETYSEDDLRFENDRFVSFDHHGMFNHPDKETVLKQINASFSKGKEALKTANFIYITWGTSNGYQHKKEEKIVSNCHKIPAKEFSKVRSTPESIVEEYRPLLQRIFELNLKAKVILSVSPVKHLKDGIIENNLSKATLLLAADQLAKEFESVHYFPSYDLLQDDLRDYRFYTKDMAHPNEIAIDYIWQYFQDNLFTKKTKELFNKINAIQQALEHRPLHPENESHKKFITQTLERIKTLEKENSFLNFEEENL